MRTTRWLLGIAVSATLAVGIVGLATSQHPIARAQDKGVPLSPPPRVVLLSGIPGDTRTEVVEAEAGTELPPTVIASLEHPPEAVVRGAVLPGSDRVVVVLDTVRARERSWASSLVLVEPGKSSRALVDRVYQASRPLVTSEGRVFVQRGRAGDPPSTRGSLEQLRVDPLTVEEVDPDSGAARVVHRWMGYETHLAGALDNELLLYRVGPTGADLVAVDMDTSSLRTLIRAWPPFARDFSVDRASRTLVAQQIADTADRRRIIERIEIASGKRVELATSHHADMVPHVWPLGGVLWNPEHRRGPVVLGMKSTLHPLPADKGVLWLRATSRGDSWVAGLWLRPKALPDAVVVRVSDGRILKVPQSDQARVAVAGFKGGGS